MPSKRGDAHHSSTSFSCDSYRASSAAPALLASGSSWNASLGRTLDSGGSTAGMMIVEGVEDDAMRRATVVVSSRVALWLKGDAAVREEERRAGVVRRVAAWVTARRSMIGVVLKSEVGGKGGAGETVNRRLSRRFVRLSREKKNGGACVVLSSYKTSRMVGSSCKLGYMYESCPSLFFFKFSAVGKRGVLPNFALEGPRRH